MKKKAMPSCILYFYHHALVIVLCLFIVEAVPEESKPKPKKLTRIVASGNKKPEKQSKKGIGHGMKSNLSNEMKTNE